MNFIFYVPPTPRGKRKFYYLPSNFFIYLFLAVLALPFCPWTCFNCGEQGLLSSCLHSLFIAVASLGEHSALQGFESFGTWA